MSPKVCTPPVGWHALSLRRAWIPCKRLPTPFEDSGRATLLATLLLSDAINGPLVAGRASSVGFSPLRSTATSHQNLAGCQNREGMPADSSSPGAWPADRDLDSSGRDPQGHDRERPGRDKSGFAHPN